MFITFEGVEGSGKTTHIRAAAEYLQQKGYECVMTREPGATNIGAKIRNILLDPAHKSLNIKAELLLYLADRVQHIEEIILPALSCKKIVLCDRFTDSTIAYQGYARGMSISLIRNLHESVLPPLKPDLTILADLSPEIGLQRKFQDKVETRFELETIAFHQKVRGGYLHLAALEPDRFRIIDASKPKSEVSREIIRVMMRALTDYPES
ncbi:MAG: dTMP kinase [Desulfobacteraceae bacterium IS3]|nr:MAG: dTMP kinase [Desulfobacteraceae bacterium IS3]